MLNFFPHYMNAQRDAKIVRLKRAHGMNGYGVFWSLLEMLYETESCELDFELDALSALLDSPEELIASVVRDFGLFELDEERGKFWSNAARRYVDEYKRKAQEEKERRSEMAKIAARARWSRFNRAKTTENAPETPPEQTTQSEEQNAPKTQIEAPSEQIQEPTTSESEIEIAPVTETVPDEPTQVEETTEEEEEGESEAAEGQEPEPPKTEKTKRKRKPTKKVVAPEPEIIVEPDEPEEPDGAVGELCEAIIQKWNEAVAGTRQVYRGFTLDAITFQNLREAFNRRYTLPEIEEAIEIAASDDFPWTLKNVLKPDNLEFLRAKKEKGSHDTRPRKSGKAGTADENPNEAFGIDWDRYAAKG